MILRGNKLDIEVPARCDGRRYGSIRSRLRPKAGGAGLKVEFLDPEEGGSFDEELNDGALIVL